MSTSKTASTTQQPDHPTMTPAQSDALWDKQFADTAGVLDHVAQQAADSMADVPFSDNDTW